MARLGRSFPAKPHIGPGAPSSPNVTVGLSGVAGSGAVGSLGAQLTVAGSGVSSSGALGSVAPQVALALGGLSATGGVGTLAPSFTVALSGVAATGAVGTVVAQVGAGAVLSGVSSAGAVGSLAASTQIALGGVVAHGLIGSVTPPGGAKHGAGIYPRRRKFLVGKRLVEVATQAELEYAVLRELQSERDTEPGSRRRAKPERVAVPEVVEIGRLNPRNVEIVAEQARLGNAPEVLAAVQRLVALARSALIAERLRAEDEGEIELLLMSIH